MRDIEAQENMGNSLPALLLWEAYDNQCADPSSRVLVKEKSVVNRMFTDEYTISDIRFMSVM